MNQSNMETVSFDKNQIKKIKNEVARGRPYADRISLALAIRIITKHVDVFPILDELDYLEGIRTISKTKKESQFTHPPLHPLWHKHFSTARHIYKNIGIRWNMEGGGNKDLTKMINAVARNYGDDPDKWQSVLIDRLIMEGYEERFQRGLTGDWIIYAKHNGKIFYLDIATHNEGKNPEMLIKKIHDGCSYEFHFLFSQDYNANNKMK